MGSYETGWRAVRGLLGATCLGEPAATIVLFALSWGSALEMLPSLDLAPNPKEWGARELSIDALRHGVYAAAVSAAYDAMND